MNAAHEGSLDQDGISLAPAAPGAYRLWHAGRVLFVGMTNGGRTVRGELMRHRRGDFGSHTQSASHFDCLAAATVQQAHDLYLSLYLSSGLRDAAPRTRI